ncbi:hypothetical protein SO802_010802 [Lithocarpus litseifolius]|uniref:Uncharacterized protein n=1 Tax=Lithocarpus litseifolius TaxID=425828 RepID=A0AAW2DF78_9ROSI
MLMEHLRYLVQKYGMKVIADLHAIQGLQNGNISGTRDGFQEWGDSNIKDTMKDQTIRLVMPSFYLGPDSVGMASWQD